MMSFLTGLISLQAQPTQLVANAATHDLYRIIMPIAGAIIVLLLGMIGYFLRTLLVDFKALSKAVDFNQALNLKANNDIFTELTAAIHTTKGDLTTEQAKSLLIHTYHDNRFSTIEDSIKRIDAKVNEHDINLSVMQEQRHRS